MLGTVNNCAGGITPWGTWLTCEENFNGYFCGKLPTAIAEAAQLQALRRPGTPAYAWGKFHDRFDVAKEPNEPNRFGWVVEIDPYDPTSTPVKRTALGRFKHEGADRHRQQGRPRRRLLGDDERFDYVYRFVTARHVRPATTAPPTATCSTTARSTSPLRRRRHGATGCRWSTARGR